MIEVIQFTAMVFSMLGAFLMSRDLVKFEKTLLYANISFLTSNVLMIYIAINSGMIPLLIQLILFSISSYINISSMSSSKYISYVGLGIGLFILSLLSTLKGAYFEISTIEVIASVIAISGSFLMKTKSDIVRINMFIMFFIADILYVYIAYEHSLIWFGIQSAFFLYTSIAGLLNTRRNMVSSI